MTRRGRRLALAAGLAAALLAWRPHAARAQAEQQELVDRATLAAQDMLNDRDGHDAQAMLRRARATVICPQVFRAGFLFAGQGGGCVLVARDAAGSWSYPAFYGMGAASFGFQAGIQDAEVMMMILTDRGLDAIIDNQFKIGADASIAIVTVGGGIEGATTAAVGADIVTFARTRGLYGGISLSGSLLGARSESNRLYYGRDVGTRQIVLQMQAQNPGADPLRAVLTRVGGTPAAGNYAAQQPGYGSPGYAPPSYPPPGGGGGPVPLAPVQQQSLPPPSRR